MDTRDAVIEHLQHCGFVDPEDGCVPIFTSSRGDVCHSWTPVGKLVDALLARFEVHERGYAPTVYRQCQYQVIPGTEPESDGLCIAHATDGEFCKPHADALREVAS